MAADSGVGLLMDSCGCARCAESKNKYPLSYCDARSFDPDTVQCAECLCTRPLKKSFGRKF